MAERRFGIQGRATGLLVAAACVLAAGSARANDVMSLGEALTLALEQGDQARIARLETDRADAGFDEVRAGYLPQSARVLCCIRLLCVSRSASPALSQQPKIAGT